MRDPRHYTIDTPRKNHDRHVAKRSAEHEEPEQDRQSRDDESPVTLGGERQRLDSFHDSRQQSPPDPRSGLHRDRNASRETDQRLEHEQRPRATL